MDFFIMLSSISGAYAAGSTFLDAFAQFRTAALVCTALIDRLAARLDMLVDDIDSQSAASEYGVDSLVAVEIRNWIDKEMESTMPILELMANQSISQLSEKIAQRSKLVSDSR
jgi:acyl carrier protein